MLNETEKFALHPLEEDDARGRQTKLLVGDISKIVASHLASDTMAPKAGFPMMTGVAG